MRYFLQHSQARSRTSVTPTDTSVVRKSGFQIKVLRETRLLVDTRALAPSILHPSMLLLWMIFAVAAAAAAASMAGAGPRNVEEKEDDDDKVNQTLV